MALSQLDNTPARRPLRVWPGVVIVVLQWLARFVVPIVVPGAVAFGVFGGFGGALAVVLWWLFLSRAPWSERLGAVALMAGGLLVTWRFLHVSVATGGMGMTFPMYAVPVLSLAFVVWAVATRRLADGPRRASMVATIVLACGAWTLVRTEGVTGDFRSVFGWRWTPTPEEQLLAAAGDAPAEHPTASAGAEAAGQRLSNEAGAAPVPAEAGTPEEPLAGPGGDEPAAAPTAPTAVEAAAERLAAAAGDQPAVNPATAVEAGADWPGFRGPERDGIARAARIATDWSASPPVELWRRPVGPGWSSFAVRGGRVYTQEQRGDDEVVAAYDAATGELVWRHHDAARFWESNGGAGPRGTPTLSNGRVYTFGATGIVNALDAEGGAVVWSRNAVSDTGVEVPYWGFASSPLVVGDIVVVAAAGQLVAYDLASGEPRWRGPAGGAGYSSPHRLTIDGVTQILLLSQSGATSVAPADGRVLWEHPWRGFTSLQPAVIAGGDLLITTGGTVEGLGTRRIAVAHGPGGWSAEERWTSLGLKPYFNDLVVHRGHAYGFDGRILACIGLEDGERKWKGGRYGHGQLVLLPDQDLLLVLSEKGELALVEATPDRFAEIARFPAIEGKTWNHPVLVGDRLLVRNAQEMVAFRLPGEGG